MKAKPYQELENGNLRPCEPAEATHVRLHMPGPISNMHIPVLVGMSKSRAGTNCWSWNGDVEKPTLRPSIINDFRPSDPLVNHVWITDGQVIFLPDSTHEFAGKTMDLLEVD